MVDSSLVIERISQALNQSQELIEQAAQIAKGEVMHGILDFDKNPMLQQVNELNHQARLQLSLAIDLTSQLPSYDDSKIKPRDKNQFIKLKKKLALLPVQMEKKLIEAEYSTSQAALRKVTLRLYELVRQEKITELEFVRRVAGLYITYPMAPDSLDKSMPTDLDKVH